MVIFLVITIIIVRGDGRLGHCSGALALKIRSSFELCQINCNKTLEIPATFLLCIISELYLLRTALESLCVDTLYLCDVMRWINVSLRGASLVHACHCEIET